MFCVLQKMLMIIADKAANNLSAVEETTAGLQEIAEFSKDMKSVTKAANDLSKTIETETYGGIQTVEKTVAAVENISVQLSQSASKFEQLQESMQSIEKYGRTDQIHFRANQPAGP